MEAGSWQFICGADLFDSHGRFAYHQDMANCTKETMQVFGRSIRLADMVQDLYCIYIYICTAYECGYFSCKNHQVPK